jgi:hypothetical protein
MDESKTLIITASVTSKANIRHTRRIVKIAIPLCAFTTRRFLHCPTRQIDLRIDATRVSNCSAPHRPPFTVHPYCRGYPAATNTCVVAAGFVLRAVKPVTSYLSLPTAFAGTASSSHSPR